MHGNPPKFGKKVLMRHHVWTFRWAGSTSPRPSPRLLSHVLPLQSSSHEDFQIQESQRRRSTKFRSAHTRSMQAGKPRAKYKHASLRDFFRRYIDGREKARTAKPPVMLKQPSSQNEICQICSARAGAGRGKKRLSRPAQTVPGERTLMKNGRQRGIVDAKRH